MIIADQHKALMEAYQAAAKELADYAEAAAPLLEARQVTPGEVRANLDALDARLAEAYAALDAVRLDRDDLSASAQQTG